ncbi:MAG: hypothetical protein NTW52_17420 [Planctomycetota bacterium]|nr:hypothetical protein [Planctomycetota bacterium]
MCSCHSTKRSREVLCLLLVGLFSVISAGRVEAQKDSFEGPPVDYLKRAVHDPVAILAKKLSSCDAELQYDQKHGFLKSVLEELDIPESSQVLVFSKTSLQIQRISPRHPRAIYFSDDVYVGWCFHGDVIELASTDPEQGAIFYSLKQSEFATPNMLRDRGQCLTCHASSRTQDVPGYLVRSVSPDKAGHPILGSGTFTTDHTSPFANRWGGWYVTGSHGRMEHMGNQIYSEDKESSSQPSGLNRKSLEEYFDTSAYLTPHSDLVALMVLEHQTQMHNAITAASFETRQAMAQSYDMNKLLEREEGFVSESAQRRMEAVADQLLYHLFMCDEFQLQDPVSGTSDFALDFVKRAKVDSTGRSLRDLDLQTRLFKYPCSYIIYSPSFDRLPDKVLQIVLTKALRILEGEEVSTKYSHLKKENRTAILEILLETKPLVREAYQQLTSAR